MKVVKKPNEGRRKWRRMAGLLVIVVAAGVWGSVYLYRAHKNRLPKELSVEALQANAGDPRQMMERIRGLEPKLNDTQREQLHENMHTAMEATMDKRLNTYFAADEAGRRAILDRDIDEVQTRRKEFEKHRAEWEKQNPNARAGDAAGGPPPSDAGTNPPPPGPLGAGGPPPGGPGPNGPPGGPGGRPPGPPTREQRQRMSESRDPDRSARMAAYMAAMRKRAQERGIDMTPPGTPPGGGPPQ